MSGTRIIPNPDLTVGADNKQRWNQPAHRRHGFHNAHHLFRRTLMVRSRSVLMLEPSKEGLPDQPARLQDLLHHPAFSAMAPCIALKAFAASSPALSVAMTKMAISATDEKNTGKQARIPINVVARGRSSAMSLPPESYVSLFSRPGGNA